MHKCFISSQIVMEPLYSCRASSPCCHHHHHHHHHHQPPLFLCSHHHHHQHHHHQFSPHCALHGSLFRPNSHSHICPSFASLPPPPPPQNPEPVCSVPSQNHLNLEVSDCKESHHPGTHQMLEEEGHEGLEAEDEEEPVFVLTDEWMEFFAKSEAKRRLAKKQAKKKGKTNGEL